MVAMLGGTPANGLVHRPANGVLAAVAAATVIASVAAGGSAWASAKATSPQKADMAELFKSYNPGTGRIGNSWWQSAVAMSTLKTYQQATGDNRHEIALPVSFATYAHSHFENANYDDTGWWGPAWLQGYQLTQSVRRSFPAIGEFAHPRVPSGRRQVEHGGALLGHERLEFG